MTEYIPFKVTFRMQSPVCLTYPWIHFDAVLAHLVQRKVRGDDYRALPSKRVEKVVGEQILPLKKTAGIYHASVSFFDVSDVYATTIYKKFCERYLDLRRIRAKKIDRSRGVFKDFRINLTYIPARKVTFYACGDVDTVDELLSALPGLGKKISIGFGFVKDFRIDELDEDLSIVREGKAMRPIPLPLLEYSSDVAMLAYKPPYWAKEFVTPCAPPNAIVKLGNNFRADFSLKRALEEIA